MKQFMNIEVVNHPVDLARLQPVRSADVADIYCLVANPVPLTESYAKRHDLIVTGTTPVGTTMFYRHNAVQSEHYKTAFQGFFEGRPGKSADFFRSMLEHCKWWTGHDPGWGGGDDEQDSNDPNGPLGGRNLDELTKGLALKEPEEVRAMLLGSMLTPRQRPLVVMHQQRDVRPMPETAPVELQLEVDYGIAEAEAVRAYQGTSAA